MDWEVKARRLAGEMRSAGVMLLICAAVIAYMTESWWGYGFAIWTAFCGLAAMGEKI